MKNYETIVVEKQENIITVSLNRPDVHNAMNEIMIKELTGFFETVGNDNEIRGVVLRGNGKSFCAGADLNYMKSIAKYGFEENKNDGLKLAALFNAVYRCPVPTIAIVQGAAFGGANGLLASCDIVIASETAKFAFSEVKLGISPATIAPFVIKRIGEFGAKELMVTGRRFSGTEALGFKLVNYALPENEMEQKLKQLINELNSAAPNAVRQTKKLIENVVHGNDDKQITNYTANLIAELRASREGQEGMTAFFDKRKPYWAN